MTTTKNNEHKKLNAPNLRFPEFQGEWEKCTLEDVMNFSTTRVNSSELNEDNYVSTENMLQDFQGVVEAKSVPEDVNVISFSCGDILISNIRPYLKKVWKATFNGGCSSDVFVLKANNNIESDYLHYVIANDKFINFVMSGAKGVKMPRGDKKQMKTYPLSLPQIQEQKKIGKMLSLLDERIATQNKIIEDLKKLKSAIIEKVFCSPNQEHPMCRIAGFEQALSTYKMSDFSSRIATKNKDSKCSLVLTIAAQYGLVNQESFFNKSVASENLSGYYLLHKGEFAYNRSYSAGYDWGAVKRLDNYDEGVLSTLYICFKINETIVDSDYLAYYFESTKWHRGLSDIAGEGARNHGLLNVSITDYFNTKHRFPVIEEQKAIAKMLNTITEKEKKATLLEECYQKQKQYLLRQMFI
ncbi:MAG: restriction endonuclease subunit S [Prevotella sp.]